MSKNSILSQLPMDLGDNLKLRFATSDDTDALAEFNTRLHEAESVGPNVRDLMSGKHPTCKASDFTVVEDTQTGKIVSSACLISQIWTYGGIPFKLGQPELVATEPEYRRRGLVRKQFEVIHALSAARGAARKEPPYAWYIRVPDLVAFLRHIQPALEKHLIGTVAEGYTGALKVSFYRSGIHLKFRQGKMEITDWTPEDIEAGDAQFPELTFLQLLCGRCRTAELASSFVDCWANDTAAILLDCLFPEFTSEVWHL